MDWGKIPECSDSRNGRTCRTYGPERATEEAKEHMAQKRRLTEIAVAAITPDPEQPPTPLSSPGSTPER